MAAEPGPGAAAARALPPREMRWWGWGDPAHISDPPAHALRWLSERLGTGLDGPLRRPVALDAVALPPGRLERTLADRLAALVGTDHVRDDRAARVLHAAGKGYPDLVRLRAGDGASAPDAVVAPGSEEAVAAVLAACAEAGCAVVPFGGGTSVVGGVHPGRGPHDAVVSLDLGRLDGLADLDTVALTARLGPGTRLPAAEAALGARGYTLGHFPQSFEFASVGGCVATRSAGQASTGYGRIDALVTGLRFVAPAARLALGPMPGSAAGPDLRALAVGSEGALGVLTEVALRVRRAPVVRRYEAWVLPGFAVGRDALRTLVQEGVAPDVARLSDEPETEMSLALAGLRGPRGAALRTYLRLRGVRGPACLAILGWEGTEAAVAARRRATLAALRPFGAVALGTGPGRAWAHGRFSAPYLRDDLLDRGVMVETLETAAPWSGLAALYRAVGDALRGHAAHVACHVSHLYPTGASLYFTFLGVQDPSDPVGQWEAAKTAASEAIVAAGGTITHHHAIGRDHAAYLRAEVGDAGLALLRAAKAELDPAGIMNPGKLLAD